MTRRFDIIYDDNCKRVAALGGLSHRGLESKTATVYVEGDTMPVR